MHWLLLRGLAREQRHWGEFPRVLAEQLPGHHVTCLDLPGAGTENERPVPPTIAGIAADVRDRFLRTAPSGPRAIVAVSLGGMVALEWCARWPGDLERAVVINTSAGNLGRPWERLDWRNYPDIARAFFTSDPVARERIIIDLTMNTTHLDRASLAEGWATLGRERPMKKSAVARQLLAAARSVLPSRIDTPLLVLGARADRLVRVSCSERIARALGAPLALHATAGHDLPHDDPSWVAGEIARWIGVEERDLGFSRS